MKQIWTAYEYEWKLNEFQDNKNMEIEEWKNKKKIDLNSIPNR